MRWTEEKISIATAVINSREGDSYNFKKAQAELPNVTPSQISKVAKVVKENNWAIPSDDTTVRAVETLGSQGDGKGKAETLPKASVTTTVNRNLLRVTFGSEDLIFLPGDLTRMYDEYRDLQYDLGWKSDFSSTLRESIKMFRTILTSAAEGDGNGRSDREERRSRRDEGTTGDKETKFEVAIISEQGS